MKALDAMSPDQILLHFITTSAKTAEATVYIPAHSDLSMVTIIPRAEAECGLHVFDWKYQTWFDVDQDCPKHLGLVFVGESMSQLIGHRLIPIIFHTDSCHYGKLRCKLYETTIFFTYR
jgi:hypothetical protein